MNRLDNVLKIKSVFFIGIGGVSMSGLAKYSLTLGLSVFGSDKTDFPERMKLENLGAKIRVGHGEKIPPVDLVVYTSAIPDDNKELLYAKKYYRTILRCDFLETIRKCFSLSIGVSGSHGKTTCTSMITGVFDKGNKSPTAFIGGEDIRYSNFKSGNGDALIFESCEYKKNFLKINPDIAVILNIDDDHLDSYGSLEKEIEAFKEYKNGKKAIINIDDKNAESIIENEDITFGIKTKADYTAKNIKKTKNGYSFTVSKHGKAVCRINMQAEGRFNVYNALASFVVGDICGININDIKAGIEDFRGVKRRNETLLDRELKIIADYAHHPKEIKNYLYGMDKNRVVVFQPHTYSRTRILMSEFINALSKERYLIIFDTYPAREKYDYEGSAEKLAVKVIEKGKGNVCFVKNYDELCGSINQMISRGNCKEIIFLGAGDIYWYALRYAKESEIKGSEEKESKQKGKK